jgi:LCP family protein required for cell wall assembly
MEDQDRPRARRMIVDDAEPVETAPGAPQPAPSRRAAPEEEVRDGVPADDEPTEFVTAVNPRPPLNADEPPGASASVPALDAGRPDTPEIDPPADQTADTPQPESEDSPESVSEESPASVPEDSLASVPALDAGRTDTPEPESPTQDATAVDEALPAELDKKLAGKGFGKAVGLTALGTLLPGAGLLARKSKARPLGVLVLLAFIGAVATAAVVGVRSPTTLLGLAVQPKVMRGAAFGLVGAAVLWVVLILGTYLVNRPKRVSTGQRAAGAVAVALLSAVVSIPLAVGASYAYTSATMVEGIFAGDDSQSDTRPTDIYDTFGHRDRINILLVGGDSGEGRSDGLGIRADTMMVASIDVKTGNTVIIQVPRNMARAQFPAGSALAKAYPKGFYDGKDADNPEYLANAIWRNVPAQHPELFTNTDYPGADATKLAIGGSIGLTIDYFVMVDIDGIQALVDAMGGVVVNINFRIAMGGNTENRPKCGYLGYLEPGPNQKLDGEEAMWYARSRCNDDQGDYGRMQRQSCLVNAIIAQANPQTMVTRFEAIADTARQMTQTDIPQSLLPAFIELCWRVKSANVSRVAFIYGVDGFYSANPDFDMMRQRVADAIAQSTLPTPSATETPGETPSASPSPTPTQTPGEGVENLDDACAYNPVK